jgi:hypothetical protein
MPAWHRLCNVLETKMHLPPVRNWLVSLATGAAIVGVFGVTCAYAAQTGGPAWMTGREMEIFLKLSAITASLVIADICWMIRPTRAGRAVAGQTE